MLAAARDAKIRATEFGNIIDDLAREVTSLTAQTQAAKQELKAAEMDHESLQKIKAEREIQALTTSTTINKLREEVGQVERNIGNLKLKNLVEGFLYGEPPGVEGSIEYENFMRNRNALKIQRWFHRSRARSGWYALTTTYAMSPASQRARTFKRAMESLLSSQEAIVDDLSALVAGYFQPLMMAASVGRPFVTLEDVNVMFEGAESLLYVHRACHADLARRLKNWPNPGWGGIVPPMRALAQSLLRMSYYSSGRFAEAAIKRLQKLEQNNDFKDFVEVIKSIPASRKKTLVVLLNAPYKRAKDLAVQLEAVVKSAEPTYFEYDEINSVIDMLKMLEAGSEDEINISQLLSLEKRFIKLCDYLIDPSRTLLSSVVAHEHTNGAFQPRQLILLSDMMLIASFETPSDHVNSKLRLLSKIELRDAAVNDSTEIIDDKVCVCFSCDNGASGHKFHFADQDNCETFLNLFSEASSGQGVSSKISSHSSETWEWRNGSRFLSKAPRERVLLHALSARNAAAADRLLMVWKTLYKDWEAFRLAVDTVFHQEKLPCIGIISFFRKAAVVSPALFLDNEARKATINSVVEAGKISASAGPAASESRSVIARCPDTCMQRYGSSTRGQQLLDAAVEEENQTGKEGVADNAADGMALIAELIKGLTLHELVRTITIFTDALQRKLRPEHLVQKDSMKDFHSAVSLLSRVISSDIMHYDNNKEKADRVSLWLRVYQSIERDSNYLAERVLYLGLCAGAVGRLGLVWIAVDESSQSLKQALSESAEGRQNARYDESVLMNSYSSDNVKSVDLWSLGHTLPQSGFENDGFVDLNEAGRALQLWQHVCSVTSKNPPVEEDPQLKTTIPKLVKLLPRVPTKATLIQLSFECDSVTSRGAGDGSGRNRSTTDVPSNEADAKTSRRGGRSRSLTRTPSEQPSGDNAIPEEEPDDAMNEEAAEGLAAASML